MAQGGIKEFMKTPRTRASEIQRAWHLVDAQDRPLGRVASQVARLLMGKHKPVYEPHMDTGILWW